MYDCFLRYVQIIEEIELNKRMIDKISKFNTDVEDEFNILFDILDKMKK